MEFRYVLTIFMLCFCFTTSTAVYADPDEKDSTTEKKEKAIKILLD